MSTSTLIDPVQKRLLRWSWRFALGAHALGAMALPRDRSEPRVYYGGARAGNVGGPLVKVKRLRERFPEDRATFNLVYALSNTPYLPDLALDLFKRRGIPVVSNQNGVFYPGWFSGDWRSRNRDMARVYHRADYVFFQSAFCRRAAAHFLGERDGPSEILFNAVDIRRFRPMPRDDAGAFRFLVTGKFDRHITYRLVGTIRGLAKARAAGLECRLDIAGWIAPEAEAEARAAARDLGIDGALDFLGPYSQEGAPAIYGAADAYVTMKHQDACPNAVIEALACGLPVLYQTTGGVPELVGDAGIGVECAEDWEKSRLPSPEEIGQGMLDLAARAPEFARAARLRAEENFDIERWYARHDAIFRQLLERIA